jgi:hypothetical protein
VNRTIWILGGVFVVLLVVLIFFLNSDGSGDLTTTTLLAGESTTTSDADSTTTTTTGDATTTTSPGETTTTTPGDTTSTAQESTTTSETTDGEWADEAIVVAGWGALGWFDGSSWVQAEDSLPVVGGESYQIAALDLSAVTTGGSQELLCEPLDNVGVQLAHEELLGEWPGPYGVAISAPWSLTPHIVEAFSDDGTYADLASDLLAERGLDVPNPVIKQLLRVDLEGDGVNEILVVTEDVSPGLTPVVGDYSMVFMNKVIEGEVQVAVLGEAIVFDPDFDFILSFSVGSVSDLSGDGKMEVVVSTAYYEGLGVEVFEYVNDDIGPLSQISAGCGS